jgi:hypothetical protein
MRHRKKKKRQREKTKKQVQVDQKDQTHHHSCLKHVYTVCILYKHVNCHTIAKINSK